MYEIDISRSFSAAHQLRGYNGNCSSLHGHNWEVQAVIRASELDEIGIALDFRKLKSELDTIINEFDHSNLSENIAFEAVNPTSEMIAKIIFQRLSEKINDQNLEVARVRVCESPGSGATYYR